MFESIKSLLYCFCLSGLVSAWQIARAFVFCLSGLATAERQDFDKNDNGCDS